MPGKGDGTTTYLQPERIKQLQSQVSERLTVIGEMVAAEPRVSLLDDEGREIAISVHGWDHLRLRYLDDPNRHADPDLHDYAAGVTVPGLNPRHHRDGFWRHRAVDHQRGRNDR